MPDLGAVDAVAIERLDLIREGDDRFGHAPPVEGQPVVGPAQRVVLVQVGEEELPAEPVVVAHPVPGDREAEDPVEDDRLLHGARERLPAGLEHDGLAERVEVAAQLLQRVHPERHPLLDHERVERQVAVAVRAVVDEIPHREDRLGQPLAADEPLGVRRQVELEQPRRRPRDGPEARGLTVGEDRAPREVRHLAHGDGLGEEHCRIRVVAGGEVDEVDRQEGRVVEVALDRREPVGPQHRAQDGLDVAVRVAVLGVHREDDEVHEPVAAMLLGAEEHEAVEEVGHPEAAVGPPLDVGLHGLQVGRVVREFRCQGSNPGDDAGHAVARGRVVVGLRHRAVLDLQRAQLLDRGLEVEPARVAGVGRPRHLRLRLHGIGARAGARGPRHGVDPQRPVVELVDRVVAEEVGVGQHDDAPGADLRAHRQRGRGGIGERARAREHPHALGPGGPRRLDLVDRARAVETGLPDAGEHALARRDVAAGEVGEHPGGHSVVPVRAVVARHAAHGQPETTQQLVEVVAVFVLVTLGEDDEPAATAHIRLDGVELRRLQPRRPRARAALGPLLGRVGDDEHVGLVQGLRGQRTLRVCLDIGAAGTQGRRRQRVARVRRLGRVDARRDLRVQRPGVAVGLVEKNLREDALAPGGHSRHLTPPL